MTNKRPFAFINEGHAPDGKPDCGCLNYFEGSLIRESDLTFKQGRKLAMYLATAGLNVQNLQSDSLEEICQTANNSEADIFVSLHFNSAENTSALGSETCYHPESVKGKLLAECIQNQIVNSTHFTDRGIKPRIPSKNGLYVLNNTSMPAVVVESCFLSNKFDLSMILDEGIFDYLTRAIARGITDYFLEVENYGE